ncbi:unnamed protein product [Caenorhabditis brenneri]
MTSTIDNFLTGSLASFVSIIGATLTILVIIGCFRIPSMKSAFGKLTINQSVAEIIPCIACLIVFFFGLTLNLEIVIDFSYIIGGTTMTMLYIILFAYFLISFNRFCAVAFPFAYNFLFKEKYLIGVLAIGWSIPFAFSMYMLVYRQCTYRFVLDGWYFAELKNQVCAPSGSTIPSSFRFVAASLSRLSLPKSMQPQPLSLNRIFKSKSAEIKRRELNFARQVLIQGLVMLCRGFWYRSGRNWMPEMAENWKIYWTTSFSTSVFHIFDP